MKLNEKKLQGHKGIMNETNAAFLDWKAKRKQHIDFQKAVTNEEKHSPYHGQEGQT